MLRGWNERAVHGIAGGEFRIGLGNQWIAQKNLFQDLLGVFLEENATSGSMCQTHHGRFEGDLINHPIGTEADFFGFGDNAVDVADFGFGLGPQAQRGALSDEVVGIEGWRGITRIERDGIAIEGRNGFAA